MKIEALSLLLLDVWVPSFVQIFWPAEILGVPKTHALKQNVFFTSCMMTSRSVLSCAGVIFVCCSSELNRVCLLERIRIPPSYTQYRNPAYYSYLFPSFTTLNCSTTVATRYGSQEAHQSLSLHHFYYSLIL